MKSFKDAFDRRGVVIIVVSFAEPERLMPYQEHHGWPFVMLADPKRIAYHVFGLKRLSLFQVFSPATLKLYFRLLREGKKIQNYGRDDYYQSGGDFLIDQHGNIIFEHRSENPADRPAVEKLLRVIDRKIRDASKQQR